MDRDHIIGAPGDSGTQSTHATEILAAAAAVAVSTVASAEPVRFDNVTNFQWLQSTLDLTQSSENQSSFAYPSGTSIYLDYFGDFYPSFSYQHTYTSGNGAELFGSGFNDNYARPFSSGELIGPDLSDGEFNQFVSVEFSFYGYDYYTYESFSGTRGLLPAGEETYLGVRLDIAGQDHFGWIGVVRNGAFVDVFAWGYETQANTAIAAGVPTPGVLGVLAFGAVGALRGRSRSA